ncbi:MAG: hypothetical protein JW955_21680, partial [Sedimentisphaerales bacterium]|nr:hypothetical protein [Sedimentisphaerales bacterium]
MPSCAPAHAMYSAADPYLITLRSSELPQVILMRVMCGMGINDAFNGMPNDTIVNVTSQKAGLSAVYLTQITGDKTLHTGSHGVKMSADAADKAVTLLHAPVKGGKFRLDGFPVTATRLRPPPVCRGIVEIVEGLLIRVVEPDPSQPHTYHGGEVVTVDITSTNDSTWEVILIKTSPEAEVEYTGLSRARITLPLEHVGDLQIKAYGFAPDHFALSNEITLNVKAPAKLQQLTVRPPWITLNESERHRQVEVTGAYDDGISRNLTHSSTGTKYQIEDPSVATVSAGGLVEACGVGHTLLLVRHEQQVVAVPVVVQDIEGP